ncbi:MAG: hypothetical protein M3Y09_20190, partial [Actinomycetota bacterium]|nr:hypothetical protein [Actinomycetota bacterium]
MTGEASAARRYLQAHRSRTPASAENARKILERHPGAKDRAIAGAPRHFDRPLESGLADHQERMQRDAGLGDAQLEEMRSRLDREDATPAPSPAPLATRKPAGPR